MSYSLSSFAFMLALLGGAWIIGRAVLLRMAPAAGAAWSQRDLLTLPLGLGVFAIALFLLAAVQLLKPLPIVAAYIVLVIAALWLTATTTRRTGLPLLAPAIDLALVRRHPLACTAVLLLFAAGVLLALSAPLEWDELAYHLPYARDYVRAGGLTVSEQLRYPLQPHNLHLLYAAGMIFGSEAATHLLHAACGALVTLGIFVYARANGDWLTGLLAAAIFLAAAGRLLDNAYVDLGASLFLFSAFLALTLWQRGGDAGFLLIAAMLLAFAVGTRYQALILTPGFVLAVILARPPAKLALQALLLCAVLASGWYLRNLWIAGDPLHPLGGPVFGYWLWDAADLAEQHADLARHRDHLPWYLLPALAAPLLASRRQPAQRSLLVLALTGLALWYLTSSYPRYLLPVYPFLALASAQVIRAALARLPAGWQESARGLTRSKWVGLAGLLLLLAVLVPSIAHDRNKICFSRDCVERVWARRLLSPAARAALPDFDELHLYQFGLEQERYLLGRNVVGDWFGPYRYRALFDLQDDLPALRRHLESLGVDSLLINRRREPFAGVGEKWSQSQEFETLYADDGVLLLRLRRIDL